MRGQLDLTDIEATCIVTALVRELRNLNRRIRRKGDLPRPGLEDRARSMLRLTQKVLAFQQQLEAEDRLASVKINKIRRT